MNKLLCNLNKKIRDCSFTKTRLQMPTAIFRSFCWSLNVLIRYHMSISFHAWPPFFYNSERNNIRPTVFATQLYHRDFLGSLHWRHNDHDGVSNHQPRGCLLNRLFRPFIQTQIKENIIAPRHWPLCGEFTGTGEFPAQRASYAENVSIWWRHHDIRSPRSYTLNLNIIYADIFSDNGLLPGPRKTVIWTNAGILFIGSMGRNFSGISIEIHTFSSTKMHLKMPSGNKRIMHELQWITIFCHEWGDSVMIFTSNQATSENHCRIASRVTKNKSLFTVTNVLFYFLHAILSPEHTITLKNDYRSLISLLSLRAVFSDQALCRHHNWSVTSLERGVLALRRHIRRLFLHAQIGAKAIFISE